MDGILVLTVYNRPQKPPGRCVHSRMSCVLAHHSSQWRIHLLKKRHLFLVAPFEARSLVLFLQWSRLRCYRPCLPPRPGYHQEKKQESGRVWSGKTVDTTVAAHFDATNGGFPDQQKRKMNHQEKNERSRFLLYGLLNGLPMRYGSVVIHEKRLDQKFVELCDVLGTFKFSFYGSCSQSRIQPRSSLS